MSASMYNSPFVYREKPLPKIKYPPLFSGMRFSFKHILDSKFLALSSLLFIVAFVISLIVIISPYWFKLVLSPSEGTFGYEPEKRELSINSGIFFINEDEMDNLVDLEKNNNQNVVPRLLIFSQVLEVTGMCSLVACLAATVIMTFRRFAAVTAYFMLAFFATLTGVLLVLVFVCTLIMSLQSSCDPYDMGSGCNYEENLTWRVFPIYSQFFRVEQDVTPFIKLNWTFYISIIAAALVIGGAALLWLEAFMAYKSISQIRYNQLRSPRSPYEGDIDPADHRKYVYSPPVQVGGAYGMQPVTFQGGPYGQAYGAPQGGAYGAPQGVPYGAPSAPYGAPQGDPYQQPQQQRGGVGFAEDPYERKTRQSSSTSSPPAGRRRSSPPPRRRSPSPDSGDDSPPPVRFGRVGRGGGGSPPPSHRRRSPSPPPRRGGPPSMNSSMSEGPFVSKEIDL